MKIHTLSAAICLLACSALVPISSAQAAWCPTPVVPDYAWTSGHDATTASLNAAFDVNKNAILAQMTVAFQRLMSAVRVDVSQQSIDGQRISQAIRKSDEALASTLTQTDINRQITKAHADFGPDGQSVNACETAELMERVSSAMSVYKTAAREYTTADRVASAPGSVVSPQDAIANAITRHRAKFCTASEARAGLCPSAGTEPGADVNVTSILSASASEEAKDAFVNNLVGLPLPKPTPEESSTPAGSLMMIDAMRGEAIRSPALVSVAAVRAMNASGGGADSDDASVNASLDALMEVYGGGSGYDDWYTELGTKNERGLMQELNKLRSISIKLRTFRSESNARVAATMAAILAADADVE